MKSQQSDERQASDKAPCGAEAVGSPAITLTALAVFQPSVQLINSTPVTNAANNRTLWNTLLPTATNRDIPGDTLREGDIISILQRGSISAGPPVAGVPQQLAISVLVGATTVTATIAIPAALTNAYWELDVMVTVRAQTGSTNSFDLRGRFSFIDGTTLRALALAGTSSFDVAHSIKFDTKANWMTNHATNSIYSTFGVLSILQ